MNTLHTENGIRYVVATGQERSQIVRLLSESFCREPMSAILGATAADLAPLVERFMPECTSNGLSVMALDDREPGTVAGVLINRDFKLPLPDGVPDAFAWFLPIATALGSVDTVFEEKRPSLQVGDALDLWMLGVDSARFGQRGIGGQLVRLSTALARERGFARCVTECTGHFSQSAAERAGFTEVTRLRYKDFRFEGRPVFAGVSAPHTHLALYEREL